MIIQIRTHECLGSFFQCTTEHTDSGFIRKIFAICIGVFNIQMVVEASCGVLIFIK